VSAKGGASVASSVMREKMSYSSSSFVLFAPARDGLNEDIRVYRDGNGNPPRGCAVRSAVVVVPDRRTKTPEWCGGRK
jgi:hypothetical protein